MYQNDADRAWLKTISIGSLVRLSDNMRLALIQGEDDTYWHIGNRIYDKQTGARYDGSCNPFCWLVEPGLARFSQDR